MMLPSDLVEGKYFDRRDGFVVVKFGLLWLASVVNKPHFNAHSLTDLQLQSLARVWRERTQIRHQRDRMIVHVHLQMNIVHKSWVSTPSTTIM
jgi:hypothetical protein